MCRNHFIISVHGRKIIWQDSVSVYDKNAQQN